MQRARMETLPVPWSRESPLTRVLLKDSGANGAARFHKPDIWHCVHLGVGKSWVASALLILVVFFNGTNIDIKFEGMNQMFQNYCKENKIYKWISKIDKFTFGGGGSNEALGTWSKASVTTTLCMFLEHLCKALHEHVRRDQCLQLIEACLCLYTLKIICLKIYIFHPQLLKIYNSRFPISAQELGTCKLNRALSLLYSWDLWLESIVALDVADCLQQFLRAHCRLAKLYVDKAEPRFAMLPKLHWVHEIEYELRRQAEVARWCLNPITEACAMDEDFIGKCAYLTRRVHAKKCSLRSIERYLSQIAITWA